MKTKKDKPERVIDDLDREEIGRKVAEGYTSGRIDNENGKRIYWELDADAWIKVLLVY